MLGRKEYDRNRRSKQEEENSSCSRSRGYESMGESSSKGTYLRMSRNGAVTNRKGVGHRKRKREGNKDVFHEEKRFCKKNIDSNISVLPFN